jgi:hypothetical protein
MIAPRARVRRPQGRCREGRDVLDHANVGIIVGAIPRYRRSFFISEFSIYSSSKFITEQLCQRSAYLRVRLLIQYGCGDRAAFDLGTPDKNG